MAVKNRKTELLITIATIVAGIALAVFPVIVLFGGLLFTDNSIYGYAGAVEYAKQYGCDKVLWMGYAFYPGKFLPDDINCKFDPHIGCMVAEKDGEEVFFAVPHYRRDGKPFIVEWQYGFTFSEIISAMNEAGVICEPDYNNSFGILYYNVKGVDIREFGDDALFARCDIEVGFEYNYTNNEGNGRCCRITQENGILKIYEYDKETHVHNLLYSAL